MANKTDYKLCYHLATKPSYNLVTTAVKEEVKKRDINCKKYESQIDKE